MWFRQQNNNKETENNRTFQGEINPNLSDCQADLECEEAIINDKERFGRVSTIRMRYLREKYGMMIADRALARIQKRYKTKKSVYLKNPKPQPVHG